jgi:hypothetical protein
LGFFSMSGSGKMKHCIRSILFFAAAGILARAAAEPQEPAGAAQQAEISPVHTGAVVVGLSAGKAFGNVGGALINLPGTITQEITGSGGASGSVYAGVGLSPRLFVVAEAAFLDGGRTTQDLGGGNYAQTKTRSLVFDASFDRRFHLSTKSPVFAYVGIGVATVQNRPDVTVTYNAALPPPGQVAQAATQVRLREAPFAVLASVGIEAYLKSKPLGFRIECKGFYPTGSSHDPFGNLSAGIFAVFGKR